MSPGRGRRIPRRRPAGPCPAPAPRPAPAGPAGCRPQRSWCGPRRPTPSPGGGNPPGWGSAALYPPRYPPARPPRRRRASGLRWPRPPSHGRSRPARGAARTMLSTSAVTSLHLAEAGLKGGRVEIERARQHGDRKAAQLRPVELINQQRLRVPQQQRAVPHDKGAAAAGQRRPGTGGGGERGIGVCVGGAGRELRLDVPDRILDALRVPGGGGGDRRGGVGQMQQADAPSFTPLSATAWRTCASITCQPSLAVSSSNVRVICPHLPAHFVPARPAPAAPGKKLTSCAIQRRPCGGAGMAQQRVPAKNSSSPASVRNR